VAAPTGYRPWRVLALLAVLLIGLTGWAFWPGQSHTPRLGLDLRGGTQVILDPQAITEGAQINDEQLQQTVEIIRQRVDGVGVAESEISVQGSGNDAVIVVSVPGETQDRIVELVGRTALLDFRPVTNIQDPAPVDPAKAAVQQKQATTSTGENTTGNSANNTQSGSGNAELPQADQPTDQQGAQIVQSEKNDAKFQTAVLKLDCTNTQNQKGGTPDDPQLWLGTCDQDGQAKYTLEPAFIRGTEITAAQAQLPQQSAGGWVVTLSFNSDGAAKLAEVSKKLAPQAPPTNQFAIVLDGVVVSAPSFNEPILGGSAQIEGNFSAQEAQDLANVLKFGALPLTLNVQSVESISPTLGADQLHAGILAGILGLILVGLYLLFYYRALGVVAAMSLILAGWITYCMFVVLGNTIGFTLTLAGIAGAIVSIGITADSFVVYFERVRDEIRDGKSLRRAVDDGWIRARRTLLAADFVSILAAVVLYFLSVGNVRGFAFSLGLTTAVDILVAFWFTRPVVNLLARTKWMQAGSSLTGMSAARLGVDSLEGLRKEPTRKRGPKVSSGSRSSRDRGLTGPGTEL
jgi:preprotein translocase subunit SecD